jgi:DNA-binding HxlR family transcriptional regulator
MSLPCAEDVTIISYYNIYSYMSSYSVLIPYSERDREVAMAVSYAQENCPVARALDVVGERWSLLILRDLYRFGAQRFQDLQTRLAGVAPNTLSARLKWLESQGVIEARLYQRHPPRYEYVLTEKGWALGPVLKALRGWGEQYGRS